jgi:hypothetical protein
MDYIPFGLLIYYIIACFDASKCKLSLYSLDFSLSPE